MKRMPEKLPAHVAIIMDGNRRWAAGRGLPAPKGHEAGAERVHDIIRAHFSRGIGHLTVWAASVDNLLKRSRVEVDFLVQVLTNETKKLLASEEFMAHEIQVRFIGRGREIVKDTALDRAIAAVEEGTAHFKNGTFTVLFGYDGREEMLSAIEGLEKEPVKKLDEETFRKRLWTGELPPVDYVIRTGGEPHWSSGFMMWHTAESQFYFTETLWPDFDAAEYGKAIDEYLRRERRGGR